ncbi:MAG: septum site-determining protein Ssd [Nakamurella sp.]
MAITTDSAVRARMERAAAVAQVRLDLPSGLPSVGSWLRASVVLLDSAKVEEIAAAGLPRRERVVVLAGQPMTAAQWQACVSLGAGQVVAADDSDYELVQLLADATDGSAGRAPGQVVAVIGACGGVGSSVFSAAVAIVAADVSRHAVLCDADPDGPGLEVTLGMEAIPGARWRDISVSHGRIPEGVLRQALPAVPGSRGGAVLLAYGGGSDAVADTGAVSVVLDAVRRGGETAVVDLPRYRTAATDNIVTRADLTVLIVPAEVRGCYAAARLAPKLIDLGARLGLVVRGPSPGGIGAGDVSSVLAVPLIASMRPQPGLARSIEGGAGLGRRVRGPLRRAALAALATLDHMADQE